MERLESSENRKGSNILVESDLYLCVSLLVSTFIQHCIIGIKCIYGGVIIVHPPQSAQLIESISFRSRVNV